MPYITTRSTSFYKPFCFIIYLYNNYIKYTLIPLIVMTLINLVSYMTKMKTNSNTHTYLNSITPALFDGIDKKSLP